MPFSRLTRVVLVAPPLGGAFLGLLALAFASVLLFHRGHRSDRGSAAAEPAGSLAAEPAMASPEQWRDRLDRKLASAGVAPVRANAMRPVSTRIAPSSSKRPIPTTFEHTIPAADLQFLNDFASQPSSTVIRNNAFRQLIGAVVPYAPFHFGTDMPVVNALEGMLRTSEAPVQIRDDRYVMVTGGRTPESGGRGRAFLWVDMQQGTAIGGIFFYPSNGEPSPTLTLFSSQVGADSIHVKQLPPAFLEDFSRWTLDAAVPVSTARYFINASNKKSVLPHDEDTCPMAPTSPGGESCTQQKVEAASMDRQAGEFLARVHYASNGTAHTLSDPFQMRLESAR